MKTICFSDPENFLQNFICQHLVMTKKYNISYVNKMAEIVIFSPYQNTILECNSNSPESYTLNNQTIQLIHSLSSKNYPRLKKIIFLSSSEVYGEGVFSCGDCGPVKNVSRNRHDLEAGKWEFSCPICNEILMPLPLKESDNTQPCSLEGHQFLQYEDILKEIQQEEQITVNILRCFQPYWNSKNFIYYCRKQILPRLCIDLLENSRVEIPEDGNQLWDFTHGDDLVQAISLVIENNTSGFFVYNIASGGHISFIELAAYLQEFLGKTDTDLIFNERLNNKNIRHCFANISNSMCNIGYTPKFDIITGLKNFCSKF